MKRLAPYYIRYIYIIGPYDECLLLYLVLMRTILCPPACHAFCFDIIIYVIYIIDEPTTTLSFFCFALRSWLLLLLGLVPAWYYRLGVPGTTRNSCCCCSLCSMVKFVGDTPYRNTRICYFCALPWVFNSYLRRVLYRAHPTTHSNLQYCLRRTVLRNSSDSCGGQ